MSQYHAPYAASAGRYGRVVNHSPFPAAPDGTTPRGMRRLRIVIIRGDTVVPSEPAPAGDRCSASVPAGLDADRCCRAERLPAGRLLFAGSGRSCIVAWRDVQPMLRTRLAHPGRLRDDHRLRCQVQVYEALRSQRIEDIAARVLGDPALLGELHPLNETLIRRLALQGALPPGQPAPVQRRAPGAVLAGDRFAWLWIAEDPTDDPPEVPSPPALPVAEPGMAQHRTTVPERYLKP